MAQKQGGERARACKDEGIVAFLDGASVFYSDRRLYVRMAMWKGGKGRMAGFA